MCLAIKTTVRSDLVWTFYFVLYKFVKNNNITLQSPPLTSSKRIFKSFRERLKLFDPAFLLLVTNQNISKKINSAGHIIFSVTA